MNIRHMFLVGVKICLIIGFKSSFLYAEHFYTMPEFEEFFAKKCRENDNRYDELRVFFRNGLTSVGDMRASYLEALLSNNKNKDEIYLHILEQSQSKGVVMCENTIVTLDNGLCIPSTFVIVGTTDCQECNKVKEFLAKNITINNEKLIVPEIIMNNPSVLLSDNK